jgi:hypothetical protein
VKCDVGEACSAGSGIAVTVDIDVVAGKTRSKEHAVPLEAARPAEMRINKRNAHRMRRYIRRSNPSLARSREPEQATIPLASDVQWLESWGW